MIDSWDSETDNTRVYLQPLIICLIKNKTAELSQRRPRDAPNTWVPWKVSRVITTHPTTFPEIWNGLLLKSILWIYLPNLTFVALPIPEIIGGTSKIWGVPRFAHAPYAPKFLRAFVRMDPVNIPAKFKVRIFIRSWDNRGYSKNCAVPVYAHAPFSVKFLIDICLHGPSEYVCQIWRS